MIPLVHDLTGETVLVVGGGPVGARKASRFAAEAKTIVVSPRFADADFGDASQVRLALSPGDAESWIDTIEPRLVVTATDDEALNDAIARAARAHDALVNRADVSGDRPADSVVVPATVRDGPVTVAVTTSGMSPALSRYLREAIEEDITGAGDMAALTAEIRGELKDRDISPADRRAALRAVVQSEAVWKNLRGGTANPRRVATDIVAEVLDNE